MADERARDKTRGHTKVSGRSRVCFERWIVGTLDRWIVGSDRWIAGSLGFFCASFSGTNRKFRKTLRSSGSTEPVARRGRTKGVCLVGVPSKEYVKISTDPKSTELDEEGLEFALASGKQLTGTQDVASVHLVSEYSQVCAGNSWSAHATFVS